MSKFRDASDSDIISYIINRDVPLESRGGTVDVLNRVWVTPDRICMAKELIGAGYSDDEYLDFFERYLEVLEDET